MRIVNSNPKKGRRQFYLIITIQIFALIVFVQPSSVNAAEFNIPAGATDALIAAINVANSNTEDDTINLEQSIHLLMEVDNETDGPNGLPSIITKITINGNESTIERSSDSPFRIFHVAAEGNLTLNNITVSNGDPSGEKGAFGDGGDGGGMYNLGTLTLINSSISGNSAGGPGCVPDDYGDWICRGRTGHGGGIYNLGSLTITNSSLRGNRAGNPRCHISLNECSGPAGHGGAIFNGGILGITESLVNENSGGKGGGAWNKVTLAGNGGGIYNQDNGTVVVTKSTFRNNRSGNGAGSADSGGNAGDGGGIYNNGNITLTECILTNNSGGVGGSGFIMDSGGGNGGNGGGIYNNGNLTLARCTLSNNSAGEGGDGFMWAGRGGRGGGIYNKSYIALTECMLSNNSAGEGGNCRGFFSGGGSGGSGGGIYNIGYIAITECMLSNNSGGGSGDGFPAGSGGVGGGIDNISTLILTNSTLSENRAGFCSDDADKSCQGGAIRNSGTANLINCTVNGNNANLGGGIYNLAEVTLTNSIVTNNSVGNCTDSDNILSLGHNLFSDDTCNPIESDIIADPLLGPLADNGGPTETHALLSGSPAIDAGDNESCPETDQRGIARPQDGDSDGTAICDIGAYEFVLPYIEVQIDIKPGSYTNSINPRSKGKIPVGILSSIDFYAPTEVDTESLTFGPTGDEESIAFCSRSLEDVNDDGYDDLVCHFYTRNAEFQCGDSEGILIGKTVDETPLEGSDSVRIVPSACPKENKKNK